LACIVISVVFILFPINTKAEQLHASESIKRFNAALLESMKSADKLGFSGRFKILEPAIKENFALSFMVEKSVGRNWETFSLEQKQLLQEVYNEWTIATYAGRFDSFSGERFELLSEKISGSKTVTVISRLIKASDEPVEFHYKLRTINNRWNIVDIHIAGVSQLALTRSQFIGILKKDGFNGLIVKLKDKIAELSTS
jgi:phospholipid transport system substrate-binding protein